MIPARAKMPSTMYTARATMPIAIIRGENTMHARIIQNNLQQLAQLHLCCLGSGLGLCLSISKLLWGKFLG